MKKTYSNPVIDVVAVKTTDVILASIPEVDVGGDFGGDLLPED